MAASTNAAAAAIDKMIYKQPEEGRRGIPEAIFIDNVEESCEGRHPTDVVARLQDLYTKYQYMQSSLGTQRGSLKAKLPDITQALETVNHLVERRDIESTEYTYQLSENIFARATVPATNSVCLWLGANVMLEYTLDEAAELLKTNEANAKTALKSVEEDTAFLRDQITTTEVNIARSHNYGVKLKQSQPPADPNAPIADVNAAAPAPKPAAPKASAAATSTAKGSAASTFGWKQDGDEVEVSVPVPNGALKSDVKVTILAESLRVEHGKDLLLAGELAAKCRPNGSTWTLNAKAGRVEITIEKANEGAWASLFEVPE